MSKDSDAYDTGMTDLLLLVLSVLRNEVGQSLVNTALLEELVELILKRDVESVELCRRQ